MLNPIATYRVQLQKEFTFEQLEQIIPYLHQLGIDTIYASPILEAVPGSTHGYDGVNPHRINPEIGTEEQLLQLRERLNDLGMNWLQDIVPNHMAVHPNNTWLTDVLEKGKASPYALFFDIKWEHPPFEGKLVATNEEINYRRFFTVNELICLNIHYPEVFETYHHYIRQLLKKAVFQGLRIDHIDGLSNPTDYLNKIRELAGEASYIVVEKILQQHEGMPAYWPVQGNTGYDFLSMVNNLFTNSSSKELFTTFYEKLINDKRTAHEQVNDKKAYILYHYMQGELNNLTQLYQLSGLSNEQDREEDIKKDIADYLIYCPVYRYYDENIPLMKRDEGKSNPELKQFYTRCMQFTGPLMAKGVEDTLMYTYNRFIGHNEVGDSPENYGLSCADFHYAMQKRQEDWPLSLNASSTHDTKRGEDARARLNVLTDLPEEWFAAVEEWYRLNSDIREKDSPDANDEYFIYQSLIANYPMPREEEADFKERFIAYLIKALRESKRNSDWAQPNETYEAACKEFVAALLDDQRPFRKSFEQLHHTIADFGIINSLSQLTLKFTCPGVPDIYQGCELWDLSFVDPDNRRAVDYEKRKQCLGFLTEQYRDPQQLLQELWHQRFNAFIKLWLIHTLLQERSAQHELFVKGDYIPLEVTGVYHQYILAFARRKEDKWLIVVVPLHPAIVCKEQENDITTLDWKDTAIVLPEETPANYTSLLLNKNIPAQGRLLIRDIFNVLPIAVLIAKV